ncbi:hypothetical protein Bca101_019624 [Brassica carinata]
MPAVPLAGVGEPPVFRLLCRSLLSSRSLLSTLDLIYEKKFQCFGLWSGGDDLGKGLPVESASWEVGAFRSVAAVAYVELVVPRR